MENKCEISLSEKTNEGKVLQWDIRLISEKLAGIDVFLLVTLKLFLDYKFE